MRSFDYIARDSQEAKQTGTIVAADQKSAALTLTRSGLLPIRISLSKQQRYRFSQLLQSLLFSRLLFLSVFCSSLARLLRSGLTIPQAVSVLGKQFRQERVRAILQQLLTSLNQGNKLSDSLAAVDRMIPTYLIALCRAGEASGSLDTVLFKGSEFFERLRRFRNRLLSALVYPSFLAVLAVVAISVLLTFVLPKIDHLYQEFQAELPWQTKLLLSVGNIAAVYFGPFVLLTVAIILLLALASRRAGKLQQFLTTFKYRLPVLGKVFSMAETADQLSVTSILISNGVPLSTALRATTSVTSNPIQNQEFAEFADSVDHGRSLAESIIRSRFVPDFAKEIIALGEEANCLEESLENSSDIIKSEVEKRLTIFMNLFEPLMVLFIALIVGFVVFSILLPLVNLDILAQ
jgi:type IV pilus assembly protein PilC